MAYRKITTAEMVGHKVSELADTPAISSQALKERFDSLSTDVIIPAFNELSEQIENSGIDKKIESDKITNMKLDEDNNIVVSEDNGVTYRQTNSAGHIVQNGAGKDFPARSRLQFSDNVVITDNPRQNKTFISIPPGEKGDKGEAATVRVGQVESADEAYVENIGSAHDAIFNFGIPRGDKGDAATIRVGKVQSGENPSVSNSGTTSDAVLNFVLPKGDKGDPGTGLTLLDIYATLEALQSAHPTGQRGDAYIVGDALNNTVYLWSVDANSWVDVGQLKGEKGDKGAAGTINVGTVTESSVPFVENVGTSENAVLNFGLQRGEKGEQGNAATISIGTVSSGTEPSVSNSGTPTNAVLDFVVPKGDRGEKGNPTTVNGKDGENITLYGTDIMMGESDDTPIATAVNNAVEKATNVEGQISDVFHYPDALTLEEIAASTDLTNKLPSASAVSELNSSLSDVKYMILDNSVRLVYNDFIAIIQLYPQLITSEQEGWAIVSTLPEGIRPKNACFAVAYTNDAKTFNVSYVLPLRLTNDGIISVYLYADKLSARPTGQLVFFIDK